MFIEWRIDNERLDVLNGRYNLSEGYDLLQDIEKG